MCKGSWIKNYIHNVERGKYANKTSIVELLKEFCGRNSTMCKVNIRLYWNGLQLYSVDLAALRWQKLDSLSCQKCWKSCIICLAKFCGRILATILRPRKVYEVFHVCTPIESRIATIHRMLTIIGTVTIHRTVTITRMVTHLPHDCHPPAPGWSITFSMMVT